jgi:hypothetical protein
MRFQQTQSRETTGLYNVDLGMIRNLMWNIESRWFLDRVVNPWISIDGIVDAFGEFIRRYRILEYLPFKDGHVRMP